MANITETNDWPAGVYQYAIGDIVDGGPDSLETLPLRQLAHRSLFQRLANVTPWDSVLAGLYGYPAGACVMHSGASWRAKVANDVEPGTDAAKWERWGYSRDELLAELPNIESVVNNTYIGPQPQKLRIFTSQQVLADMPNPGVNYVLQTLTLSGARRMRIFAHASFRNDSTSSSCTLSVALRLNGVDVFGGHYLGAEVPARNGGIYTQIPISILDTVFGLNPALSYTITLVGNKGLAVGPILVQDSYIDVEYV